MLPPTFVQVPSARLKNSSNSSYEVKFLHICERKPFHNELPHLCKSPMNDSQFIFDPHS